MTLILTSDLVSRIGIESGSYPVFIEVGFPNLVCECNLECQSVTYHFGVTVTLTSDHVFLKTHVLSISLVLFEIGIPNLVCGCILGWWSVMHYLRVTVNLNLTWPSF